MSTYYVTNCSKYVPTVRTDIRMSDYIIGHLFLSRGLNTKKCYGISLGVHAEIFHNKIRR